jgi:hypothetical protein
MAHHNQFVIHNDSSLPLVLNIEPEGTFFSLGRGEEVSVVDQFTTVPLTLKLSNSEGGDAILSVWPGDGAVRVEKDGVDVLDLVQSAVNV